MMPEYDVLFAKRFGDLKDSIVAAGKKGWRFVEMDFLNGQYLIVVEKEPPAPKERKESVTSAHEFTEDQIQRLKKALEGQTKGIPPNPEKDEIVTLEG